MFSHLFPEKHHKCVLKPSEQCSFFQDYWFEESHASVYSKNERFTTYVLGKTINVCWNPQNSARFSKTIDLRDHMPRFSWKIHVFPPMSLKTPQMCVETLRTGLVFSETIDLRGHMPRFTLKMKVFPSISWETPKLCVETSEQCLFFRDNQFEGSHA